MKLNDFRKLFKVKLNQCNIILIILLLFVVLTYTSIVPYITNLLKLEKEQEIEEFRLVADEVSTQHWSGQYLQQLSPVGGARCRLVVSS